MKNIKRHLAVILFSLTLFACLVRCGNEEEKEALGTQKNSELALYMRDVFNYSLLLKEEIIKDSLAPEKSPYNGDLAFIKTAIPTDHGVKGDVFNAYSDNYLNTVERFYEGEKGHSAIFNFNNMVTACVNCHTHFCPGPIKKIKKLYIE